MEVKAKVFITGNADTLNSEAKIRRNIQTIMTLCYAYNRDRLDTVKLKSKIIEITGNIDISTEAMLEEFTRLTDEQQIQIIKDCTVESKPEGLDFEQMSRLLNNEKYIYDIYEDRLVLSDSELRKRIKYCKNPMEKQMLQRELSGVNYANGKHHKGKRRKH